MHSYISPRVHIRCSTFGPSRVYLFCLRHVNTAFIYLAPPVSGIKDKTQSGDSARFCSLESPLNTSASTPSCHDVDQIQLYQIN